MCDVGYYLAATTANMGRPCLFGLYDTDPMRSVCVKCPGVGSCPRAGKSSGMFVPPSDGGTWLLDGFGACLDGFGAWNMATRRVRSGYCEDGFRQVKNVHQQECVKCNNQITCKRSKIVHSPCQDMTQYFDHDQEECLGCPDNYICDSLSDPRPNPDFDPQTRAELATVEKILMPYWIDESNIVSRPFGKECFSKRRDDRRADCDVSITACLDPRTHTKYRCLLLA